MHASKFLSLSIITALLAGPAVAATRTPWMPSGVSDFAFAPSVKSAGGSPTGEKPESKLFYTNDGQWWAVLGDSIGGVSLFELVNHSWQRRLSLPGTDPWMRADTLFDEVHEKLYVSLRDNKLGTSGNPRRSLLHELTYNDGTWTIDGAPTQITGGSPETLTIARDSLGRLWTAFEAGGSITVGYTSKEGRDFTFKSIASGVSSDDIAAVTSFGDWIGVLWSNQKTKKMMFASRSDSTDPTAPSAGFELETAYGGGTGGCGASKACADDHINLKVAGGKVYAVIKTSLNDGPSAPGDPLIVLLRRDAGRQWTPFTVAKVGDGNTTKPALLLAPELDEIYVFTSKGGVKVHESPFTAPSFSSPPRQWTASPSFYPSTTKQPITPIGGAVVETTRGTTSTYWHNEYLPAAP